MEDLELSFLQRAQTEGFPAPRAAEPASAGSATPTPPFGPQPPPSSPPVPEIAAEETRRAAQHRDHTGFHPRKPATIEDAGLTTDFVEQLICRYLLTRGASSGRRIAQHTGLPFRAIEPLLAGFKNDMLVAYKKTAGAGDYEHVLTDAGTERARRYMATTTYADTAPVLLEDYVVSVAAQNLARHRINPEHLQEAFFDLLIDPSMIDRLGPAINAGKGMFLYGSPGNGKTSIAERVIRCFGSDIWIPRSILVDGDIIRLFDPVVHQEIAGEEPGLLGEPLEDARWVRIHRPTVIVGGELTMDQLEISTDPVSNVSEAPMQMKSNCGVLVIDDFGRQRMPVAELLNRWIVPLEKRFDYQKLASGKKIQVPFDQLVVFSTNLEPKELVDEAFLRRIPYKIETPDPTPDQFRRICLLVAPSLGFVLDDERLDALMATYAKTGRAMRGCHPRDLLLQARSFCLYHKRPVELSDDAIAFAIMNYFAIM